MMRIKTCIQNKMSFVFLCGGQGKRFETVTPCRKPTMLIFGRPMYTWVLESVLQSIENPMFHVVIQNDSIGNSILFNIQKHYSMCDLSSTRLDYYTRGPAETCMLCTRDKIINDDHAPFWVLDNDILYDSSIAWNTLSNDTICVVVQEMSEAEKTLYTVESPYSHVSIKKGLIENIVEKKNIGDHVVLGAYGFGSPELYQRVFETFSKSELQKGEWFMSSIIKCAIDIGIKVKPVYSKNSVSIGTPNQLQDAIRDGRFIPKSLRWVFDLDETLVTLPSKCDDYSTVLPIPKTIEFLKHLYNHGHYIIIHTARHMKTCENDVDKVKERVEEVTKQTLKNMDIPYHELVFGKPYGNVYVDDKSTNPLHWNDHWLTGSIGFGWDRFILEKDHNIQKIVHINHELCYKIALIQEGLGNKFFVDHCPKQVCAHIPKLYDLSYISDTYVKLLMEWKSETITVGKLYMHDMLDLSIFDKILHLLQTVHSNKRLNTQEFHEDIMQNYYPKFLERYHKHDLYKILKIKLNVIGDFFKHYQPDVAPCIHGDYWFSNLLWSHKEKKVYMIDMRGRLGDKLAIHGDRNYDFAKLLQSIYGFDSLVLQGKHKMSTQHRVLLDKFMTYFKLCEDDLIKLQKITAFLVLGSIPFHGTLKNNLDEVKNLISFLWPKII